MHTCRIGHTLRPMLMDLPTSLQLRVLRLVSPRPRGAEALSLVCRQWQALLRENELLQLQLICAAGTATHLDVGSTGVHVASDDDTLQVPVHFEAVRRSAATLPATVVRAARHALLLLRRSAWGCAVSTLRLERHNASGISVLMPAMVASISDAQLAEPRLRPQQLVEVHLTDAVLPTSLGTLLVDHGFGGPALATPSSPPPPRQRLRLWNCRASHPSQVAPLALGLASLRLDTFVWASDDEDAAAPSALLDAEGWHGARRLGLWLASSSSSPPSSYEGADGLEEPNVEDEEVEGWCRAWRRASAAVEELAVRCAAPRASPSPSMAAALRRALLCGSVDLAAEESGVGVGDASGAGAGTTGAGVGMGWRALRTLQMDPTLLSSLVRSFGGAAALLAALPALTTLGCVDVPWQQPSSFFETLPVSAVAAQGAAQEEEATATAAAAAAVAGCACQLTTLFVCVNSPGAPASTEPHAHDWLCLSQDGLTQMDPQGLWGPAHACALSHVVHQALWRMPRLERLLVAWYDEDDLPVHALARVLAPLGWWAAAPLSELFVLRASRNCGGISDGDGGGGGAEGGGGEDGAAQRLSDESAACVLQAALPRLRVCVRHEAAQTAPGLEDNDWLLELWGATERIAAAPPAPR